MQCFFINLCFLDFFSSPANADLQSSQEVACSNRPQTPILWWPGQINATRSHGRRHLIVLTQPTPETFLHWVHDRMYTSICAMTIIIEVLLCIGRPTQIGDLFDYKCHIFFFLPNWHERDVSIKNYDKMRHHSCDDSICKLSEGLKYVFNPLSFPRWLTEPFPVL